MQLARARTRIVIPLTRVARAYRRLRAWRAFGDRNCHDHTRERFGRSGRWLTDLANLGDAFERFPELARAVCGDDAGRPVSPVAALQISRVADEGSISAWIELCRTTTVNGVKAEVAAARKAGSAVPLGVTATDTPTGSDDASKSGAADVAIVAVTDSVSDEENDDPDARMLVSMRMQAPVRAAFESDLLLYRANVGSEATVEAFVQGLLADAQAGPHPPDVDARPLARRPDPRRSKSAWPGRPRSGATWASRMATPGSTRCRGTACSGSRPAHG